MFRKSWKGRISEHIKVRDLCWSGVADLVRTHWFSSKTLPITTRSGFSKCIATATWCSMTTSKVTHRKQEWLPRCQDVSQIALVCSTACFTNCSWEQQSRTQLKLLFSSTLLHRHCVGCCSWCDCLHADLSNEAVRSQVSFSRSWRSKCLIPMRTS